MDKKTTETNRIPNELLLQTYKPVMILKLSIEATTSLGVDLKKLGDSIMEKTGYTVLVFPNEEITSGEIISVCGSKMADIEEIKEYIYKKNKKSNLVETPFNTIKNIIEKRDE
jgi:uncharacterized protein YcgL (UPF0745 family)